MTFKRILRPDEPVLQRCGALHACDPRDHESECSACDDIYHREYEEELALEEEREREQRRFAPDDFDSFWGSL